MSFIHHVNYCRYAKHKFGADFRTITEESFQKFLAICIRMGIIKMPSVQDYWATGNGVSCPGISDVMSRNCFSDHLAALYLAEPLPGIYLFVDEFQCSFTNFL